MSTAPTAADFLSAMPLRLPHGHDPLTVAEQDVLFDWLARRPMDAPRPVAVARMRATLRYYRDLLASANSLELADAMLPDRLSIDGLEYLNERRCRQCGCTDNRACPGGCAWVEDDLCSRCSLVEEVRP